MLLSGFGLALHRWDTSARPTPPAPGTGAPQSTPHAHAEPSPAMQSQFGQVPSKAAQFNGPQLGTSAPQTTSKAYAEPSPAMQFGQVTMGRNLDWYRAPPRCSRKQQMHHGNHIKHWNIGFPLLFESYRGIKWPLENQVSSFSTYSAKAWAPPVKVSTQSVSAARYL